MASAAATLVVTLLLFAPQTLRADAVLYVDLATGASVPSPLRVAVDADDDDENGIRDCDEPSGIHGDELAELRVSGATPGLVVRTEGALRLVVDGRPVPRAALGPSVHLQGLAASKGPGDAALVFETGDKRRRVPVTVVGLSWLDASNAPLDPARAVLGVSRRVTHDRSLPRESATGVTSDDPENVRVEIEDASAPGSVVYANLVAYDTRGAVSDALRKVALRRIDGSARFRSDFIRLVADRTDKSAPDVGSQLLKVRLRDRVAIQLGDPRAPLTQDMSVGHPGQRGGERSALRGKLRLTVLRFEREGAPVVGETVEDAERLSREQVVIANEIWAQCFIDFGRPEDTEVRVVDPPPPALLSIADGDGLPAAGDGQIRLRIGDKRIGPIATRPGGAPIATAQDVARALARAGFVAQISPNPRTDRGAGGSVDLIVRDARGTLVSLAPDGQAPLTTDSRQQVEIGRVDLRDGVQEFDNDLSAAGTLEERALIKLVADSDPTTIDVILINHFVSRDRQGEAFIESDLSPMANTLIFDRNAVRFQRQAWVQAHELGHVLLDEPFHPDNLGPDRSYLLMDSDARQGRVTGPKRLSDAECKRARRRSGPSATPALLSPAP